MAETPFGPGTVLAGRFTLDDLLDDTDGARFWRATDQTLARSVAVHVLADSDPRADALLTAARTSALVTDGHLLRVLDAAAEDGVVYVVNEWGSGVSLDQMLVEGPLSPRRAAWVVKEVAEAIATAHRNGVAHGRLLPEKVMVTEAGSVKLIGFVVDAVLQDRAGRGPGPGHRRRPDERPRVRRGQPRRPAVRRPGRPVARHRGLDGPPGARRARPAAAAAPGARRRPAPPRRDLRAGPERRTAQPRRADRDRPRDLRRAQRLHRRPDRRPAVRGHDRPGRPTTWPVPTPTPAPRRSSAPAAQPGADDPGHQDTGDLAATGAFSRRRRTTPRPAPRPASPSSTTRTPASAGSPTSRAAATTDRVTDASTGADGPAGRPDPAYAGPAAPAARRPRAAAVRRGPGPARHRRRGPARGTGSFPRSTGAGNGRVPAGLGTGRGRPGR